jgi:aldose 1-epimerase
MEINNHYFGKLPDDREARLFCFKSSEGMQLSISNYGGTITSLQLPNKQGDLIEICIGFNNLADYLKPHPYFGATVGRYANRIANGSFNLNGDLIQLAKNFTHFQLHGGENGFHTKLWNYELEEFTDKAILRLAYYSPDKEEGYPGNLKVEVAFTISENNSFEITYTANTDKPTHLNLTNHAYFNLGGYKHTIEDHYLAVDADYYLELNENQIPTGKMLECADSPFDFSTSVKLADKGIPQENPLDFCFVLKHTAGKPSAQLYHSETGIKLNVITSQPGIQLYTANYLDASLKGHNNVSYKKHHAICLETQAFPDSPNQPNFPSTLLLPGETYLQNVHYQFLID